MAAVKEAWAMDVDMENRDPNNLNDHLQVTWEDLIGEPEHTSSIDCVWKYSFKCFNLWKTLCYIISTTLCSILVMVGWGCYFAQVAFCHIWLCVPGIKAIEINMSLYRKCVDIFINSICDPFFESCGKICAGLKK